MTDFLFRKRMKMESLPLSGYDFVVLGVFLLLIARGMWIGLLKQVVPLLALYLGYFAASRYHAELLPFLSGFSDNSKVVFIAACVILFVATYVAAALLGKAVATLIQITITPWFDRILGAILGFAKALIIVVLGHMIVGAVVAPENRMFRSCAICPTLDELTNTTREIIRNEDVKESLKQQKPAISLDSIKDTIHRENSGKSTGTDSRNGGD